jgi:hypothetical protein
VNFSLTSDIKILDENIIMLSQLCMEGTGSRVVHVVHKKFHHKILDENIILLSQLCMEGTGSELCISTKSSSQYFG